MPDLPTADEAGLKGFELGAWHGIYAPKGTPDDIIQKLPRTLQEALRDPDLVKRFNDINTEPVPQDQATPEALKAQLISEVDRWAPIIKAAGSVCGLRLRLAVPPPNSARALPCAICAAIFGGSCASQAR